MVTSDTGQSAAPFFPWPPPPVQVAGRAHKSRVCASRRQQSYWPGTWPGGHPDAFHGFQPSLFKAVRYAFIVGITGRSDSQVRCRTRQESKHQRLPTARSTGRWDAHPGSSIESIARNPGSLATLLSTKNPGTAANSTSVTHAKVIKRSRST